MKRVLVVDDRRLISDIVRFDLARESYGVYTAYDGEEALEKVAEIEPGLILLDLMLSEMDDLEVAREVRKTYDIPITTVTAEDSEVDRVLGLELDADDYVVEPLSNRELAAHVKANLCCSATATKEPEETASAKLTIGNLTIHPEVYMVVKRRETVGLTHRELELLSYLAKHLGQVMIRECLLQTAQGHDCFGGV